MATLEKQITFLDEWTDECCQDEFCLCHFTTNSELICSSGEEFNVLEWAWDNQVASPAILLSKQNREVRFHPAYSSGTAAVRGDSPFKKGNVYYWEIKMLTSLYGTDVMVGVGTKAAELQKSAFQFCSLLGSDEQSWGFSYTGRLQHNGKSEWYGPPFGKDSIIGIYLDMWQGTLEFFLNRRPLGIAFRSMNSSVLYPMVCSTAAQSAMRVILSVSHPVSLKLLSLQALRGDQDTLKQLLNVPGLRKYICDYWWLVVGRRDEDCELSLPGGGVGREGHKLRGGRDVCHHQEDGRRRLRRLCLMCDIIL